MSDVDSPEDIVVLEEDDSSSGGNVERDISLRHNAVDEENIALASCSEGEDSDDDDDGDYSSFSIDRAAFSPERLAAQAEFMRKMEYIYCQGEEFVEELSEAAFFDTERIAI